MEKNTNSLAEDIQTLLTFILDRYKKIPPYKDLRVTINNCGTIYEGEYCYQLLDMNEIYKIKEFEEIYIELKKKGYSWINLNCAGILEGDLLLTLELPNDTSNVPFGYTSINLSGPILNPETNKPYWDANKTFKVVTKL